MQGDEGDDDNGKGGHADPYAIDRPDPNLVSFELPDPEDEKWEEKLAPVFDPLRATEAAHRLPMVERDTSASTLPSSSLGRSVDAQVSTLSGQAEAARRKVEEAERTSLRRQAEAERRRSGP